MDATAREADSNKIWADTDREEERNDNNRRAIKSFKKNGKSPVHDKIIMKMLNRLWDRGMLILLEIISKAWNEKI